MTVKVTGGKKFTRTINFYKKEKNWVSILDKAAKNVAAAIRDDAEKRVYTKFTKRKGKLGKSIKPRVYKRGNNVYLSLSSNHPAAGIMEYGGPSAMPSSPSRNWEGNPGIVEYAYVYSMERNITSSSPAFELARGIYKNQPFKEGTFFMRNALRAGLPALEGEVIRVAKAMPKT